MGTKTSSDKKTEFLGIPFGTANARLKKMILFSLLKKHNENICFRCGLPIENIEELSIEHKKPWQGIDIKLFWDLENIAYSHLGCNISYRESKKNGNTDKKFCKRGHEFTEENISKSGPNGKYRRCVKCRSEVEYPLKKRNNEIMPY